MVLDPEISRFRDFHESRRQIHISMFGDRNKNFWRLRWKVNVKLWRLLWRLETNIKVRRLSWKLETAISRSGDFSEGWRQKYQGLKTDIKVEGVIWCLEPENWESGDRHIMVWGLFGYGHILFCCQGNTGGAYTVRRGEKLKNQNPNLFFMYFYVKFNSRNILFSKLFT